MKKNNRENKNKNKKLYKGGWIDRTGHGGGEDG
jgi:hypothetical protein